MSLFYLPLYALISSSIILPTGAIYGINYKLLLTLISIVLVLLKGYAKKITLHHITAAISINIFLIFYALISLFYGFGIEVIISQLIAFYSMLILIFVPLYLVVSLDFNPKLFIDLILNSFLLYCLLKIIFVFLIFLGFIDGFSLISSIGDIFGYEFIGLETNIFFRIHFPIDYLSLPLAYYLVRTQNGWKNFICFIIIMTSVFISYSRMLWALTVIVLLISYSVDIKRGIALLFFFAISVIIGYDSLYDFVINRFTGVDADTSDQIRGDMFYALYKGIASHPFLGHGLGSYSNELIRQESIPWYYELQWMGFAFNFGLIGALLLFVFALYPIGHFQKIDYRLGLVYLLWIGVNFFNGFMLTSSGGVIFLCYFLIATLLKFE